MQLILSIVKLLVIISSISCQDPAKFRGFHVDRNNLQNNNAKHRHHTKGQMLNTPSVNHVVDIPAEPADPNIKLVPYNREAVRGKQLKTLCFHDNDAGERGTQVALYDYADYAEVFWGVKSVVFFPNNPSKLKPGPLKKFQSRFKVVLYGVEGRWPVGGRELLRKLLESNCDFFYVIKAGTTGSHPMMQSLTPEVVPVGFHAVFNWQPHGSSYAAISPDVTGGKPDRAVVPHMVRPVNLEEFKKIKDMREELKIPKSAIVLCRHGGIDTFDIQFALKTVWDTVQKYNKDQLHYILMNTWRFSPTGVGNKDDYSAGHTQRFDPHPQIHHIPAIVNLTEKEPFFRTCNAMLHARSSGETFGLSVAEFSVHNLPVLTWSLGSSNEHVHILKEKAMLYDNEDSLKSIIHSLVTNGVPERDYNGYRDYEPDKIMAVFKKHFLDPIFNS